MSAIHRTNLDALLSALGDELGERGACAHLLVIGGSALVAGRFGTRATRDVDVVALVTDGELRTAEPFSKELASAAKSVARNFNLEAGWLNAGPTSLLSTATGLPEGILARALTQHFGPALTVSFAGRRDLIFFKVYALSDRDEARDLADLRTLAPEPDELHAAARWVRTHNMPGPIDDQIAATLRLFNTDDRGRGDDQ
jgi:hypothetical protein